MGNIVLVEQLEPSILSVTLNRPERRNALSIELLEALVSAIRGLQEDSRNRVIILRGAGPVFSAGLDLQQAADSKLVEHSASAVHQALSLLQETSLIVIAAVQGGAFAGGAGLMAACDIVVAANDAKIGFPEARRGLLPALICQVLRHKVREGDLRDLFLAGEAIDGTRAQQMGLVQRVVPSSQLLEESLSVARAVIAGGPATIRKTKLLLNESYNQGPGELSGNLIQSHLAARNSPEAAEGLAAFLEKRDPQWK